VLVLDVDDPVRLSSSAVSTAEELVAETEDI
jgi:hypothetical protein